MSKILADLLDQPQTIVETAVARLEHLSGYESTDVRLLADINNQVRAKTAALGLDPDDTTGEELYHALRAKITADNRALTKRIGLNNVDSPEAFVRRFVEFIQHADIHPEIWALKWSTAKKMLREHPPKKLMKRLGYRSVESMLKRESTGEILAALPHVESERWLNVFWREVASVNPSEFEDRRVQIVVMYPGRWGKIAASSFIETMPHTGVIALWLGRDVAKLGALGLGLQLFEAVATLKAESSYLKLRQFEAGFGEQLLQVVKHDLQPFIKFTSLKVDWHTVCHHLGKLDAAEHVTWSPPHVSHEDIHTHKPLDVLSRLDPALSWWSGLEHTALHKDGQIVSLNAADLLDDHVAGVDFQRRSREHLASSLWHELMDRYLHHDSVKAHVLNQLEGVNPQPVAVTVEDYQDEFSQIERQMVGANT